MFQGATAFKQKLCGATWVYSEATKNAIFERSSGSISRTVCTSVTRRYVSRQPTPERELIARKPISTLSATSTIDRTITCPKCATFQRSGRVSCCAPGGAWFKNCGGFSNKNVDHKWSEGVDACKRKFNAKRQRRECHLDQTVIMIICFFFVFFFLTNAHM